MPSISLRPHRVTVNLSDDQLRAIERLADEKYRGCSVSLVVSMLIQQQLDFHKRVASGKYSKPQSGGRGQQPGGWSASAGRSQHSVEDSADYFYDTSDAQ